MNHLNCLTRQISRKGSGNDLNGRLNNHHQHQSCDRTHPGLCLGRADRSLSGNLVPPRGGGEKSRVVKKTRHRVHASGPVEYEPNAPRLVRSCGMRRDWSFEDLRQNQRLGKFVSF